MKRRPDSMLPFIVPITIENTVTMLVGLVMTALVGDVSDSGVAAITMPNTLVTFYFAAFAVMTSGSAVLVSRFLGAGERELAGRTVEQSILLSVVTSSALSALSIAFAGPIMRLLMPNAEAQLFGEAVDYFRSAMYSFPFYILYSTLTSIMRASGNARASMAAGVVMNAVQVGACFLFMPGMHMGVAGAGWSYVVCRAAGTAMLMILCLRERRAFQIRVRGMLRPDKAICLRVFRVGLPTAGESVFVQIAYLAANMMAVGLGTWSASVYSISCTIVNFSALPCGIASAAVINFTGHLLGANKPLEAKKCTLRILYVSAAISMALSLAVSIWGDPLCALYTRDQTVIDESVKMIWLMILYNLTAISINVIDSALRAGGDVKYVMWQSVFAVYVLRLPLTWLLAYKLNMGVAGIFVANIVNLTSRALMGLVRFHKGKWMYLKV